MIGPVEIERRLGYHPATSDTVPKHEWVRSLFTGVALAIDEALPPGRELASSLTALQEALMWANAAIACNQPKPPPTSTTYL